MTDKTKEEIGGVLKLHIEPQGFGPREDNWKPTTTGSIAAGTSILFSDRLMLEAEYNKWLVDTGGAKDCPANVFAWALSEGLMDRSEVRKFLNNLPSVGSTEAK